MWYFVDAFQNSYAIIIVMKASYKEAGKTRKWLFSVVAGFMVLISCLMPLIKSVDVSAATQYELVLRTDDGKILKTVSLGNTLNDGGNYVARVNAGGNGRYSITIENNLTGQVLGTLDNISPDRITANNDSSFTNAQFNFKLELWQDGGTVASGTPISVSGGMEKRAWVIAADDDGDGTYEVRYSQPSGEGHTSMTDRTVDQNQIGATVQGNSAAQTVNANDDSSSDEDKKSVKEKCISSGAAGSLGWIVCPIMVFLADTSTDLYDAIEPMLSVSSDSFNQSADLFKAWQMFQQFANVAFVILFMVVVISQITGIGINNYGIKKILPKLIVAAVLVNVSYWLCIIAADVSNIVGNSIQNLLNSLGPALPTDYTSVEVSAGAVTAVTAVPILAALVGGGVAIALNPAILLGLLISAIGLVVSLLTLLVLLAAREAIIVVLIVISPIAFVCYMLPNTKKAFDKWLKIGEAMLLVYPTCGLMVGAGNFVSKLLINGGITISGTGKFGAFVGAFVALLVGIVPIFFIPSVIKKSFAAAGDLGAKISGYGQRISRGAQRGIRDSNAYKQTATRMNAGVNRSGNLTGLGKARAKIAESRMGRSLGMDRAMAGSLAQAKKNQEASNAAGAMLLGARAREGISKATELDAAELGGGFAAGQEGAYYGRMFIEAAEKGNETQMSSAIEAMRNSNMKPKDIAKLVRYAENKGKLNFNGDSNARAAWLRDLSKNYGNDFLSTDMELATWAKTGGSYGDSTMTRLGDFGEYASGSGMIGNDDVKPEDIARLSGDSLAAMAVGKQLNSSMAKSVLASSPNLSADKKIMLSAIAGGATVTDANAFKEQAKVLMNANEADFANSGQTKVNSAGVREAAIEVGGKLWTRAERDAMTSAQPRTVNIVDIDSNGLIVPHGGGGGGTPPTPTPTPPPTPPTPPPAPPAP